jgi:outer membrane protein TolC
MERTSRYLLAAASIVAGVLAWASVAAAETITLKDAIDRALRIAPSIGIAAAASDTSVAHVNEQRAPLFPSIGTGAEYYNAPGYDKVVTNRALTAGMVTLDYTLWDWGRRQARLRAAEYVAQAARLGVTAARAQTVFDVTVAYFDLLRARSTQRELQASLERLARYVSTIEALQRSGRSITNDVLKVRTTRDGVELSLDVARGNTQRAAEALGALIGVPNNGDLDAAPITGVPSKYAGNVAESPVMVAAERAIASAKQQVWAARSERLPTFQAAFTTGFLGVDPHPTLSHNFGGSYDTVVSMPLLDGGLISSHVDLARAKQNAALAQLRQAEYLIRRRILDASSRYDQAMRQLEILSRAQPTADDAFALTWARFLGGGSATMLEVIDSYQFAEGLRVQRHDQEFAGREAAAETNLLYGRIQ